MNTQTPSHAAGGASTTSATATTTTPKERHYAQLAGRLALLSQNVIDLHGHIEMAAEQSLKTRVLAANQASLFMSANAQELDRPARRSDG
ncbi:unnamed protein product [Parajaminaea phylloscopi]